MRIKLAPRELMRPFAVEPMRMWPISTRVNKPENRTYCFSASFVTAADGHGGTLITATSPTANQQMALTMALLTPPHA